MLSSITVLSQANANPCAGLWLGQIVANPERCDQYYMCVLTRPVPVDCEPNEVFDITEKMCVPGDPTTCEIGERTTEEQSSSTTVTFSESTTTSEPPVDLGTICRDVFFAAKPYPNSLEIYVGCIRGIGVLFTCLENEFFHPVINECIIRPEQTTDSPGTQTTSRTDTTVEIETTTSYNQPETTVENEITSFFPETTSQIYSTTLSPLDGICNGIYYNFIEHPTKCALYIFCFDEKEFVRQCPEFKIFDIESES